MADRADHYRWADELIWQARRGMKTDDLTQFETRLLELLAGIGHATLAAAGPGVEAAVRDNEKAVARALGAAEGTQKDRQAARPPLPLVDLAALRESVQGEKDRMQSGVCADFMGRLDRGCERCGMSAHLHPRPKPAPPLDDPGHPK